MQVDEGLDTGGVYACADVPIGAHVTAAELRDELVAVGTALLVEQLARRVEDRPTAAGGRADVRRQDHPRRIARSTGRARPSSIDRLVRVGGAWTTCRAKRIKILEADISRRSAGADRRAARGQAADDVRRLAQGRPAGRRRVVRVEPGTVGTCASPTTRCGASRATAPTPTSCCARPCGSSELVGLATARFVTDLVYGTTRMRRACDCARRSLHRRATRRRHADAAPPRRLPARVRRRRPARGRRRDGRPRAQADAGLRQRRAAQAVGRRRRDAMAVATRPGSAIPTGSSARLVAELGADRRRRGAGADERAAAGHARAPTATSQDASSQWVRPSGRGEAGRAGPRRVRRAGRQGDRSRRPPAPHVGGADHHAAPGSARRRQRRRPPGARSARGRRRRRPRRRSRPEQLRRGADRRAVLRPRCAPPPADARWRIEPRPTSTRSPPCSGDSWSRGATLVRPGGRLVYSVCTLTAPESIDARDPRRLRRRHGGPRGSVAAVRARLAGAAAGRRHRRDDRASVPSPA